MMTNNDDNFRWDCIKGTRAIKDKIDAEFLTMDALFEHLVKRQQERERDKQTDMQQAVLR
jgi:hypothetical protein